MPEECFIASVEALTWNFPAVSEENQEDPQDNLCHGWHSNMGLSDYSSQGQSL